MNDIASLEIVRSKTLADSNKYFELFEKYIDDKFDNCLLFEIGNEDVICKIMEKNPDAQYFIYDDPDIQPILKAVVPDYNKIKYCCDNKYNPEEVFDKMGTVKFDKIIMNPPYCKNLHLKVLEKAIQHLTDDGECVNLSPVRWLQDPFIYVKKNTDFKKFENTISKHIIDLNILNSTSCNEIFNIELYCDLGIYHINTKQNNFNYSDVWKNKHSKFTIDLFEKIKRMKKHLKDMIDIKQKDGIRVMIADIAGNRGALPIYKDLDYIIDGKKNGIDWTKCKNNGGYEKEEGVPPYNSIKFNTENEALNFYNSCKTSFYKFIANEYILDQHIPLFFLPWMGDEINPRTGKKGYESEWTNEDFYKFFNITEDEQKIIEETMEKYK